jgi:hypothetical protein
VRRAKLGPNNQMLRLRKLQEGPRENFSWRVTPLWP